MATIPTSPPTPPLDQLWGMEGVVVKALRTSFSQPPQADPAARNLTPAIEQVARKSFAELLPCDRLLAYGLCLPPVAHAVGTIRIFYGVVLLAFGIAELVNKIAQRKLKELDVVTTIKLLQGGLMPVFVKAFENIATGMTVQASFFGYLTAAGYELFLRPYMAKRIWMDDITVDPKAFDGVLSRLRKHSLYIQVAKNVEELRALLFEKTEESAAAAPS